MTVTAPDNDASSAGLLASEPECSLAQLTPSGDGREGGVSSRWLTIGWTHPPLGPSPHSRPLPTPGAPPKDPGRPLPHVSGTARRGWGQAGAHRPVFLVPLTRPRWPPTRGEELEGDLGVPPGTASSAGGLPVLALAGHVVSGRVEAEGQSFVGDRKGLFSQGG